MTHRILIVEDEPSIAELIAVNLSHAGFEVEKAMQTDLALTMMKDQLPSLIILDWMMPGKSGVQFAKELRANERTKGLPILMLTAKSEEADKVLGLDSGADDYVTKPFGLEELLLRVSAVLRRTKPTAVTTSLSCGPITLTEDTHTVTVNGEKAELSPTEFDLLRILMQEKGKVLSRSRLLREVWNINFDTGTNVVDTYISYLRRKVHTDEYQGIKTVRGVGFQMLDK